VQEFCDAWSNPSAELLASFFTEDAVYHNIPTPPMVGLAAIRKAFDGFMKGWEGAKFEMVNIAANGNVVLTERIDHISMQGKKVSLPVAGVFEVEGEKIKAWRDYFDMAMFTNALK
jgi:limonene-1,2-epoxide hydrolase